MEQQYLLSQLFLLSILQQEGWTADAKYFHILKTCQFIEKVTQSDIHYQIQYQYNGRLQALYNSSTEEVVGFTTYGKMFADQVNKSPEYLQVRRNDLNYYCKVQAAQVYQHIKSKAVAPVSRLTLVKSDQDSKVLVCSAYNFYPRQIRLNWLMDGVVIPEPPGTVVTEMPGGAWRYQIHSYLDYKQELGRNITCMVEHMGLQKPQLLNLGQSDLQSNMNLGAGVPVLSVGLIVLLVSVWFYCRKTR